LYQVPLLSPAHIRATALDEDLRAHVDAVANKLIQWIEHLRSTTDFIVPDVMNRVLDLCPRVKIIFKNINNTEFVDRIINAPEPSAQAAIDVDDSVRLCYLYSSHRRPNSYP
jgi:hypothetical protein